MHSICLQHVYTCVTGGNKKYLQWKLMFLSIIWRQDLPGAAASGWVHSLVLLPSDINNIERPSRTLGTNLEAGLPRQSSKIPPGVERTRLLRGIQLHCLGGGHTASLCPGTRTPLLGRMNRRGRGGPHGFDKTSSLILFIH